MDWPLWKTLLVIWGVLAALSLVVAFALLWWLREKLKALRIDDELGLAESLRRAPFLLVVALDLLDLGLDLLSAPIVWAVLHRLGWSRLRNLATAAAAIPGTQFVPVLTLAWGLARLTGNRADRLLETADRVGRERALEREHPASTDRPPAARPTNEAALGIDPSAEGG